MSGQTRFVGGECHNGAMVRIDTRDMSPCRVCGEPVRVELIKPKPRIGQTMPQFEGYERTCTNRGCDSNRGYLGDPHPREDRAEGPPDFGGMPGGASSVFHGPCGPCTSSALRCGCSDSGGRGIAPAVKGRNRPCDAAIEARCDYPASECAIDKE